MKKLSAIIIAMLLIISLYGCKKPVEYNDGTFTHRVKNPNYGYEEATVTILNGEIVEVVLRRIEENGTEANYDLYIGEEIDGKTYPNLKQYRFDLAEDIIEDQSPNVDSIAGATASSKGWKSAVAGALEKAQKK